MLGAGSNMRALVLAPHADCHLAIRNLPVTVSQGHHPLCHSQGPPCPLLWPPQHSRPPAQCTYPHGSGESFPAFLPVHPCRIRTAVSDCWGGRVQRMGTEYEQGGVTASMGRPPLPPGMCPWCPAVFAGTAQLGPRTAHVSACPGSLGETEAAGKVGCCEQARLSNGGALTSQEPFW